MKNEKGFNLIELLFVVVVLGLLIIPISLWTNRNLDFWISHFKGEAVDVPMWISVVSSIVLNAVIVAANLLAEIARFLV